MYKIYKKITEAKYKGKEVELNKPSRGDVKKYKVYVKNPKTGNVKKINFGDKNMEIKRDDPERRKSFRARHNCDDKKDKTTPGYWSCKFWSDKKVSDLLSESIHPKEISLNELPIDLYDPSEAVSLVVENNGDDFIYQKFEIKTLTVDYMKQLTNNFENILEVYNRNAKKSQNKIVEKYVKMLLEDKLLFPDNLVILDYKEVVDGNHRVIAGIKSNKELLYIDLSD
jgi:hypothetical protein